ncbi:MAG: hypothetical protein ACI86M_001716 [Saprospiraceae bacterium]|jgi:hypothetical protein
MKIINSILLLIGLLSTASLAQEHVFEDYGFDDTDIEVPAEFLDKEEVTLFLKRKIDIVADEKSVVQYYLHHEKILLNSDEAIEKNNRIYIQVGQTDKFVYNRNRVILPSGDILELSKDDIHEEVDPESGYKYEYYAVKGLEKGAIIEKLYLLKELPEFKGGMIKFQYSAPILEADFEFFYPDHLILDYKSYNGLSEAVSLDSTAFGKKMLKITDQNIPAVDRSEKMSNPAKHLKGFRYKLFENTLNGKRNFYNYAEFVEGFHPNLAVELEKKEKKALRKFMKPLKLSGDNKIKTLDIEHFIKSNIVYNVNYRENENLVDLIKSKQSNLYLLLRLYRIMLLEADIKSEIVLSCDRFKKIFDKEFETTNHLDEAIIYVPSIDQYIDPTALMYRTPLFGYELGSNYGLKIKEVEFGGSVMAAAELIEIKLPGMDVTSDTMRIFIDFSEEVDNPKIQSKIQFGGYAAANMQPIIDLVPPDQYDEIIKDIAKNYAADVKLDNIETKNGGLENVGKEKFELIIDFHAGDLIQSAGDKILFKLGQVIGKQSEIYQTEKRQYPVEIQYPHHYDREIKIRLPEGYKISNPEVLEMYFETKIDGKLEALFDCKYAQDANVLTITNEEYYQAINYPIEKYEDYRAVINAAADFNKIVLVLEK